MDYGSFRPGGDDPMGGNMHREVPMIQNSKRQKSKMTKQLSLPAMHRGHPRFGLSSQNRSRSVYSNLFPKERKDHQDHIDLPTIVSERSRKPHSYIYTMLNSKSRQRQAVIFKNIMASIIIFDVVFFIVSTEPSAMKHHSIFYFEEGLVSSFFLVEYIVRLWTVTESTKYGAMGPWKGRFWYMTTFHAIIDALATFPFFLELVVGQSLPKLTYLRFFRLMRILRTDSSGKAMDSLTRVLYYNSEILYVAGIMALGLIIVTAVLMYYLRPRNSDDGEDPWSIPTTMYYSTLMLTGQGGPDPDGDLPWYTKSVIILTGLFSIGMFAIPASMLTWGFEAEAARVASKTRKRHLRKMAGESEYLSSSSSSSSWDADDDCSANSSDVEYLNLIAGEASDDDDDNEGGGKNGSASEETLQKVLAQLSSINEIKTESLASANLELQERMDKLESKMDQILNVLNELRDHKDTDVAMTCQPSPSALESSL